MTVKKIEGIIVGLLLLILNGCAQNGIIGTVDEDRNVLTITAALPGESVDDSGNGTETVNTRIALMESSLDVKLTWEVGDMLYLVYTQGAEKMGKQMVTLTADNITREGKKASFDITIPDTFSDEPFNLYGVYGATGFDEESNNNLTLPSFPWSGKTLEELQEKDILLLRFAAENIQKSTPDFSVAFAHVGSLFHIRVFNSSDNILREISKAELIAETAIQAYQYGEKATYNPVTGLFSGTTVTATSLPFEITQADLTSGDMVHFWGWYPPVADQKWPALALKITTSESSYTSTNTKPARTTPTAPGKVYHFYACYDGTNLNFTNRDLPEGYFIDERDGTIYALVNIGNQTWMKENLAYLPSVVGPKTISKTEAYQYVHSYDGTDVAAAKATDNYKTYGVLYNWIAAMNGEADSDKKSIGVQGVCPDGWHLPSNEEWIQMETYLAQNGHNYDGSNGGSVVGGKIAKSLAASSGWSTSVVKGSIGNTDYPAYRNKSGFSALPGGFLQNSTTSPFTTIGLYANWWTSSSYSIDNAWRKTMVYSDTKIESKIVLKSTARSVRCVRDY